MLFYSLQFIKNRPEPIRTAGYKYAGFAAYKISAPSKGHHVFLHITPCPIGEPLWHMPFADEFVSNFECVTAPFRFERETVGIGLDEFSVERFLDDRDSNLNGFMKGLHAAVFFEIPRQLNDVSL